MKDFSVRPNLDEAMDNPALDAGTLALVFDDLNRTNAFLGGQRLTIRAVSRLMKQSSARSFRVVDMGCGDGDLLRRLAAKCRQWRIDATFTGLDINPVALGLARERSLMYPEIQYRKASLLDPEVENLECDIVLCTLTLHHFEDSRLPHILKMFATVARLGVVINDLQRNRLAYQLFRAFSLIFIKTKIAKKDGLISIRRGFRKAELKHLSEGLPCLRHSIQWRLVFRYLWVMQS